MNQYLIPVICIAVGILIYWIYLAIHDYVIPAIKNTIKNTNKKAHILDICLKLRKVEGNPLGIFPISDIGIFNTANFSGHFKFYIGFVSKGECGRCDTMSTIYSYDTRQFMITLATPTHNGESSDRLSITINEDVMMKEEMLNNLNIMVKTWKTTLKNRVEKENQNE